MMMRSAVRSCQADQGAPLDSALRSLQRRSRIDQTMWSGATQSCGAALEQWIRSHGGSESSMRLREKVSPLRD